MSEGLDFADANARCVVILGLPFPNAMDPQVRQPVVRPFSVRVNEEQRKAWVKAKRPVHERASAGGDLQVKAKKAYNSNCPGRNLLSGDEWYQLQAFRSVVLGTFSSRLQPRDGLHWVVQLDSQKHSQWRPQHHASCGHVVRML